MTQSLSPAGTSEADPIHAPSAPESGQALVVMVMLFGSTLWGLYWLPLRWLDGAGLGGLWAIALIYVGATAGFAWHAWAQLGLIRSLGRRLVGIGLAAAMTSIAFGLGMIEGEVARVMILFYLSPIWALVLGLVFLRERLSPVTLPALGLALAGALFLLWPNAGGLLGSFAAADLLGLVAGLAFAATNVQLRGGREIPSALKNLGACFLTAPIALGLALAGGATLAAPAWALLASLALGLVWMTAMTAATQYGVSRLPLQRSSVLLLFELVVGVVSAALLAGEGLSGRELMGGGCIVLAGLAVVWQTKPRSA